MIYETRTIDGLDGIITRGEPLTPKIQPRPQGPPREKLPTLGSFSLGGPWGRG